VQLRVTIEIDGEPQTFELSDETADALKAIAARNNLSFADALQQAIANENFIEDQQATGKLLIEQNGTLHELVRKPQPA
jgi:predicted transcriptional regulator